MRRPSAKAVAARALACLDLTNLDEACTAADIDRLCARAVTRHGPVAAVCVWPRFVPQAKALLAGTPVKVATVVNFPEGDAPPAWVEGEIRNALADGADEIDAVIPWRKVATEPDEVERFVARLRKAARDTTLKTILETGALRKEALIRAAADIAIRAGADFLKTSTGKVKVNATPAAARVMLGAIAEAGGTTGFKAAGGIRGLDDAAAYLALADEMLGPDWAGPKTFRFGASGLLDALLAELGGGKPTGKARTAKGY